MQTRRTRTARYGPWLVGLGAALWGTESAWRIPLNALFDAKVIVFWEHVFILIMFLPILVSRLYEIPKIHARTCGFLLFSGFAGSAVFILVALPIFEGMRVARVRLKANLAMSRGTI